MVIGEWWRVSRQGAAEKHKKAISSNWRDAVSDLMSKIDERDSITTRQKAKRVTVPKAFELGGKSNYEAPRKPKMYEKHMGKAGTIKQTIQQRQEAMRKKRDAEAAELARQRELEAAEARMATRAAERKRAEDRVRREAARREQTIAMQRRNRVLQASTFTAWTSYVRTRQSSLARADEQYQRFLKQRLMRRVLISIEWRREELRQDHQLVLRGVVRKLMLYKYLRLLEDNRSYTADSLNDAASRHKSHVRRSVLAAWHAHARAQTHRRRAKLTLAQHNGAIHRRQVVLSAVFTVLRAQAVGTRASRERAARLRDALAMVRDRAAVAWGEVAPAVGVLSVRCARDFERGLPHLEIVDEDVGLGAG